MQSYGLISSVKKTHNYKIWYTAYAVVVYKNINLKELKKRCRDFVQISKYDLLSKYAKIIIDNNDRIHLPEIMKDGKPMAVKLGRPFKKEFYKKLRHWKSGN